MYIISVMLLELICVTAVTICIDKETEGVPNDYIYTNTDGWAIAAGWIIFAASLTLITELIMLLLHFLTFSITSMEWFGKELLSQSICLVGYCQVCHYWYWSIYRLYYHWSRECSSKGRLL